MWVWREGYGDMKRRLEYEHVWLSGMRENLT